MFGLKSAYFYLVAIQITLVKFFKNLYRLILIGSPLFIILNYIKNFLLNYKTKKKSKKIENVIYDKFKSINYNEKWFCNNLNYLSVNFKDIKVEYSPLTIIIKTPRRHDKRPMNLKKFIFSLKKK